MSFTDYSGFRQEVKQFLDWSDATTTQLDSLIRVAEPMINSVLRVREMERTLEATVDAAGTAAVPSDYLELKNAYIDGSPIKVLERSSVDRIFHRFANRSMQDANAAAPEVARDGSSFIFGPVQGEGSVMKGRYYGDPASQLMADSGTIHATFSKYAQVYLFGVAANAAAYTGEDARIQVWKQAFAEALALANGLTDKESQSGGVLVAKVG
jgi:hypothetical protein